jgi:20S proteasome subunit beta 4
MDSQFAFVGSNFVVVVADTASVQQIIVQKSDEDKILQLDSRKLLALSGPKGDVSNFGEFVKCNLNLYRLKNGRALSTSAAAHWTRNELAKALRSGPYQVNGLFAGYDDQNGPELYFLDYLATMHKVNSSGHGYGGMFSLSLFDKHWVPNMSKEQSLELVRKCVAEIQERLVVAPEKFLIKIVSEKGVEQMTMVTATGEIVDPSSSSSGGGAGGGDVEMKA